MKKIISTLILVTILMVGIVGCNKDEGTSGDSSAQKVTVNSEKTEVTIPAEVNGKYFNKSTRHGVVFKDGSNGEKSILRGLASEKEFHQALTEIGAEPGNNLTLESGPGKKVEGSKLDVFVAWDGQEEIPFDDIVKSTEKRPMDIRFGGNLERAEEKNTGCILCLDSCPVGITSNHNYATGESEEIDFYGNEDVLPKDGTKVTVIFRQAE